MGMMKYPSHPERIQPKEQPATNGGDEDGSSNRQDDVLAIEVFFGMRRLLVFHAHQYAMAYFADQGSNQENKGSKNYKYENPRSQIPRHWEIKTISVRMIFIDLLE